ncbi:MAG: hypothetical protein LBT14_13755 [Treponema sp.]|jgi:hypothetical protein|nr:hypothetical protein [Treponema sp.]
MAKDKEKAVYAPGELEHVRGRLGVNPDEAKRMAKILGGEVGVEKNKPPVTPPSGSKHKSGASGGKGGASPSQPHRRVELASGSKAGNMAGNQQGTAGKGRDQADDPSVPIKVSYSERLKMDKYAAYSEFEIKNSWQVLSSMFSFFNPDPDYVNPRFIVKKMNEYYKQIELLVVSTRTLFPRNNLKRNTQLKKTSPFMFSVLEVIRYWNIERITSDMTRMQAHPRNIRVRDFADILRAVYKPLFLMELLDVEAHIKPSFKLLYQLLYIESPTEAKNKYQPLVNTALDAFETVRKDIHYLLYPLLMKLLSDKWLSYNHFFTERRNRIIAFLYVSEEDRLSPEIMALEMKARKDHEKGDETDKQSEESTGETVSVEEGGDTPEAAARRAIQNSNEVERKAVERGLNTLQSLFPKAGWDRLPSYPDLYPYFVNLLDLKKGFELLNPLDPLLQVVVLMRILEELLYGLRYVSFGSIIGPDGDPEPIDRYLGEIINNWQYYIENGVIKEYLSRLIEYCQLLETSIESRNSNYAKRLYNELHWIKRLYFLPYYQFDTLLPPPFQRKDITSLYPEVRKLRKYLTIIATGIEQGSKQGGADKRSPCDGINNPWDPYVFQVSNPISKRLDMLLSSKKRNNASLVFYTLAITTVLDHLINNENSWAYGSTGDVLFRTVNGEGVIPQFGVDERLDADAIFKQAMKERAAATAAAAAAVAANPPKPSEAKPKG